MTAEYDKIIFGCYDSLKYIQFYNFISRRVGMADEADSKSVVGDHVRVQVPPPAVRSTDKFGVFFICLT